MRLLATAEEKDLRVWLKEVWLDAASAKELQDLIAIDVASAIEPARRLTPALLANATTLTSILIDAKHHGNIVAEPQNVQELIAQARELSRILEQQRGLREQILVSGLPALGKVLSDAAKFARTPAVESICGERWGLAGVS